MKFLSDPRTWLGLLSLALVLWLVARDVEKVAPGPLHPSHAQVEELDGVAHCDACHTGSEVGFASACVDCHGTIAAQLEGGAGFHARFDAVNPRECAACHVEHHGADLPLVGERSFALAGNETRAEYAHEGLGFALHGAHLTLECAECHEHADVEVLPPGQRRFQGLEQRCETCHDDPHAGAMSSDCAACHGQAQPFPSVAAFAHDARFPLTGAHAGRACVECHAPGSTRSIEASLANPQRPARGCADCHAAPHSAERLTAWATLADDAGCASCHAAEPGGFGRERSHISADAHARSGFALEGAHAAVACASCHGSEVEPWEQRFPGRAAADCSACHTDPHAGQFADRSCAECHGADAFVPTHFGAAAHARAGFALDGVHADVGCAKCHEPGAPTRFVATPADCVDCHDDVHRGAFADGARLADGRTDCAACHAASGFRALLAGAFDHGRATGFALEDAHAQAECAACHVVDETARACGRRLGFLADRLQDPTRCVACHSDPHDGLIANTADCARCHGTRVFADVATFDHGSETGFALVGAHARNACVSCHGAGGPTRLGRAAAHFPGDRERCATCHVDPHDGLFEEAGDCASCHGANTFALTAEQAFDHAAHTGFALRGSHASADCAACHAPLAVPDFLGRRSARALGTTCAACHTDPHLGQFTRDGATDCARCHTESSFEAVQFDHTRDARFALDATHAVLDCNACHKPHETPGGARAIRYRPLGTRCVDCHGKPGDKR